MRGLRLRPAAARRGRVLAARAASASILVFALSGHLGCTAGTPLDYGDPTSLNTPTSQSGIVAWVVSPRAGQALSSSQNEIVVAAYTEGTAEPLSVSISVAGDPSYATAKTGPADGPDQRFTAPISLLHGINVVRIRIVSDDGAKLRTFDYNIPYDGDAPGLRVGAHAPKGAEDDCTGTEVLPYGVTRLRTICAVGTVSTKAGTKADVPISLGTLGAASHVVVPDASGVFRAPLALAVNAPSTIVAQAGPATAKLEVIQDEKPPALTVDGGPDGIQTDDEDITLSGTVADESGIESLTLRAGDFSTPIVASASWKTSARVQAAKSRFTLVARDRAGNESSLPFDVVRNRVVSLRAPNGGGTSTTISLTKEALQEFFTVEDQKATSLAEVPLRPAIVATLRAIRAPAESGVDTSTWGQAEWNLHHLLNMTPDNANLTGTSLATLLELALAVGLPPARILAQTMDIDVTDTFVDPETLADVVLEQLVGTHPNITHTASGEVAITISLHDAFNNLSTLASRFGPSGGHPGILFGQTYSEVFEPGFLMSLPVKSSLESFEGVSGTSRSKQYYFRQSGSQLLSLDFTSDAFSIVGLVDQPTADMTFRITENAAFIAGGTNRTARPDPAHAGFYRGNSAVWDAPKWQFESIVSEAAYRQYRPAFAPSYTKTLTYDAGSIQNAAVIDLSRGWLSITTSGGLGAPPPPIYVWDLLSEIAQVKAHTGGIAEGQANTQFRIPKLSLGLTAAELIERVKPTLQAQEAELAERLVGSTGLASTDVDVYFVPGFFFFRAEEDGMEGAYPYTKPGLFSDPQLTKKISSKVLGSVDDTTHEKVSITGPGQKLYFQTPSGEVTCIEVLAASEASVSVRILTVVE